MPRPQPTGSAGTGEGWNGVRRLDHDEKMRSGPSGEDGKKRVVLTQGVVLT